MMCGARGAPRPWMTASGTRARIACLEPIAQRSSRAHSVLALGDRELRGAREADGASRRSPCPGGGRDPASRRDNSGSIGVPRRMYSAPIPFGAPILWPEIDEQVERRRARVDLDLAERLHGVGVEERAARLRALARARRSA